MYSPELLLMDGKTSEICRVMQKREREREKLVVGFTIEM
jgi:hypothetical protein